MSCDWVKDVDEMQHKFGVHDWIKEQLRLGDFDKLYKFLEFRMNFLAEELNETREKGFYDKDPEEIVDGCIDLCVVAIGTLNAFGIDAQKAWDIVYESNMLKKPGVKPERPNPLNMPDLIKPEGWVAPSHKDNHGVLPIVIDI